RAFRALHRVFTGFPAKCFFVCRRPLPVRGWNMRRPLPIAAASAAIALWVAPATAQDDAGDRVNTVIVYGDDECEESSADELVICVRMNESDRYRIPEALRQSDSPANQSWSNRVQSFEAIGDFGPLSCSPVGAGG